MTKAGRTPGAALVIRLYIAGKSPSSVLATRNLKAALARMPAGNVLLEIVDVLLDPERGFRDGVIITPTLIRTSPAPTRRVVGDLTDREALIVALEVGVGTAHMGGRRRVVPTSH